MTKILVLNGPNLNLLGEREVEIYGSDTLEDLTNTLTEFCRAMNIEVKCYQTNHEGDLLDQLHEHRHWADGVVLNPGALTHYSYALRDAVASVPPPVVEVHLSDITRREAFRKHSVIADVCVERIMGLGHDGYFRAVEYLAGLRVTSALKAFISSGESRDKVLKHTVKLLKDTYPKYTWVGIYVVEGTDLVLHNFLGKPTPHERIPIGQGICGAAVAEKQTIIVDDVKSDPRYLACSIETRSEIVVPIQQGDAVFAEIDIDSDDPSSFHDGDRKILEACAELLLLLF